jgi:hypothetical protein
MDFECEKLTNVLKHRALIPRFECWTTKDLKRIAKIGHVLDEIWSTWFLHSLPLNALCAEQIMTFLEKAGDRSWWTRPDLLENFRVKFLSPVI